jgi:hypothetical protein
MSFFPPILVAVWLLFLTSMSAMALELRSYDADLHDRFVNFPENPSFNPTFQYDPGKFTAVGWDVENTGRQYALITRCHALFAYHHAPAIGSRIRFLSTSGTLVERTVAETKRIINPTFSSSDLCLITLSSPIEAADGIDPLPYLNLPSEEDYLDQELIVFGSQAKAGRGRLSEIRTININWIVSRSFKFDYYPDDGGTSDARIANGDSGSPSLVDVDGRPALLGVHLATSTSDEMQSNYDAFIPYYVEQIDSLIAAAGFRMTPVNSPSGTLGCAPLIASASARQGHPLDLDFVLTNPTGHTTGNLEVEITFPESTAPDSLSAEGWVVTGGGNRWLCRRASLDASAASEIRASWASAPCEPQIHASLAWTSDTSSRKSSKFSVSLSPSFHSWASDLPESDPTGDPDKDGRENLEEYALGGDPLKAVSGPADGTPPQPSLSISGRMVTFSYPERSDKLARGLHYATEWSEQLGDGQWTTSPPPGCTISVAYYHPDVPGFVEKRVSWPAAGPKCFVRLNISETQ